MMKYGKYTTEQSITALSRTVDEIEESEVNEQETTLPMGKYGSLFWDYLKENHPGRHGFLLSEMTLREVCMQVDTEAREKMEMMETQLRAKNPPPKGDFMAMVQYKTQIRDQAEEFVLSEIVFKPR